MSVLVLGLVGLLAAVLFGGLLLKVGASVVGRVELAYSQAIWLAFLLVLVQFGVSVLASLAATSLSGSGVLQGGSSPGPALAIGAMVAPWLGVLASWLVGGSLLSARLSIGYGRALLVLLVTGLMWIVCVGLVVGAIFLAASRGLPTP